MTSDEHNGQELPIEEPPGPPPDPNSPAERFYAAAISRVLRGIIVLGLLGAAFTLIRYGLRPGLGFLFGTALAYWNLRFLVSTVNALGERIVVGRSHERGGLIVARFIVRILLVVLVAYAIFKGSPVSLPGFLVGLCMPVPALMWEAGYEGFAALRRGL